MIKKRHLNITIDDVIVRDMITNNVNISGTVNKLLQDRKKQVKNLNNLLEIIEKIELNINNKTSLLGEDLVTEIKSSKPLIKETIEYLKTKTDTTRKKEKI